MPKLYFLCACAGSSVDQQSNNVTLFNLVEQINVPPGAPPPPRGIVPIEVHAYYSLSPEEIGEPFEARLVMVASTGLETPGEVYSHKSPTARLRTRTAGLPFPPVTGPYALCVDTRRQGTLQFYRDPMSWPINIAEVSPRPPVTH